MKIFSTFLLLSTVLFLSCNSTNKSVTTNTETEPKMDSQKMIAEGFIMGTISTSKIEGDCPITIKVEGKSGVYYLDPIDLSEEFKNDGENVWFKFGGLRRMNRCDKASPINIIEIQKRN